MSDLTVVETPANWERLKAMVLDSVSSPITKRVYNMALEEFLAWFREAPRPGFTKATGPLIRFPRLQLPALAKQFGDLFDPRCYRCLHIREKLANRR